MPNFYLALFVAAAAGGASSGPDLEERAAAVNLPVDHVMVFSDRARVTRKGSVKLGTGVVVVRPPDLPGAVMLDTVRVTASGAKVVRVETRPIERERWSIDQVDQWLADLETVGDKIASAQGRLQTVRNELNTLANLDAAPPVPEKDRLGKPAPVLAPDAWRALQDHLGQRRGQARNTERALEHELFDLQKSYDAARREVQKRNIGGYTDHRVEVLVILEGERADGELSLEYAVPGAYWKPAYDLYFDPDANKVELLASGLVSQATGEDWQNTKLALSTAIPGLGIDMPVLETWTLGDDREWQPYYTARTPPRTTHPFQPPAPKPRLADVEKDADRAVLASRSQLLLAMAGNARAPAVVVTKPVGASTTFDFDSDEISGELAQPDADASFSVSRGPARPKPAMRPPPAPPMAMPSPPPAAATAEVEESDAPSSVSRSFQSAGKVVTGLFGKSDDARGPSYKALALGAEGIPARGYLSDPSLPAVAAGGLDYVYDAPIATNVPSQADHLRVPLAARSYDVTTFYEATPSLAKTAFLKATVKNGSKLPILAGPANIFVKRTFAGDAQLATTGPGGVLELPLGADEDIRLTRTVVPATKTQGFLIGQEDVTEYTVTTDIGNYKKRAVTLRVVDQIPKTNNEKMKVELVSASPQTVEKPDGDGLVYWHVDLPAGATKKITMVYRVTRPKDWRLSQ